MSKPVPGKCYFDLALKLLDATVKRHYWQSLALTKLAWLVLDAMPVMLV